MNCPFCSSSEIKNRKLIENDLAWSFLGNTPIVPGHSLVVPKRCVAKEEDLQKLAKIIMKNI